MKKKDDKLSIPEEEKDWEEIKRVHNFMCKEGLFSLDLEEGNYKIRLKRYSRKRMLPSFVQPVTVEKPVKKEENLQFLTVKTPLTGTLYSTPSPKAQPFVESGQVVEKGQILCIIEAMKVMNEILAERRCRIEKILVENGQLVTADQNIFFISPV